MAAPPNATDPGDPGPKPADEAGQPGIFLFGRTIAGRERLDIKRTWPVLFLIVAALLFCRQPYALIHPTFFAEDGSIFFKQQYEMGFLPALVTRYAGYLHFAPRIIAALCSWLPVEYLPAAYTAISLLVAAGTLTFFYAPGFRTIISHDLVRACIVICFTLMPNAEVLMTLANVNWYLLFFTSLLVIFPLPKRTMARWPLLIPAGIAAWSSPATVVCVPVMLYRAWKAGGSSAGDPPEGVSLSLTKVAGRGVREVRGRVWGERLWWFLLIALTIGYLFTVEKRPSQLALILHERKSGEALLHGIGYRVFDFFFLGPLLAYPLPWEGWGLVMAVSLPLTALCLCGAVLAAVKTRSPGLLRTAPLILFYMIVAIPTPFVLRREWHRFFLSWSIDGWQGNDRYFFSSTLLLCVLCGVVYERALAAWILATQRRRQVLLLALLCWLILQGFGFRMDAWHTKKRWSDYARQIHEAEIKVRQTGHYESVHVKGSPAGFDFDLMISAAPAKHND